MTKSALFLVFGGCLIVIQPLLIGRLHSEQAPNDIVWKFDEAKGPLVHDSAGNRDDQTEGQWRRVAGVEGGALEFDGYTTRIVRSAQTVPSLGKIFSLSAWVAVNNYPWNWVPILDQSADHQVGYFFGMDAFGHIGFDVAVDGVWQQLTSNQTLPLKKWVHVTAVFDSASGLRIFINGVAAGNLKAPGAFWQADKANLYVGRVRTPQHPFPGWLSHPQDPISYSLDGYLDEVKILNHAVSAGEEKADVIAAKIPDRDVLPYATLPPGPAGTGPFGAMYATLEYTPTWDRLRRTGPDSDVVVRFDQSPIRLVFWQGANFIPSWVTENGKWYTDEFVETWGPHCPDGGDCEPMSDKQSRYSRVSIIESTPARAVIHWRYALAESRNYKGGFADPDTGWFDWADEYWFVYPDGVALRKQILWSSDLDAPREWQESIVINGPGQRPEDNIEADALTLVNMSGEIHTYGWGPKSEEGFVYPKAPANLDLPANANIQVVNLKSAEKPFQIVWPRGNHLGPYMGEKSYSMFTWWNHWPVAQVDSSGRPAVAADRASSSSLSHIYWDAYQKSDRTETKLLMDGLTSLPPQQLVPLAKSWLSPPSIHLTDGNAISADFDPSQRAFVIHRDQSAKAERLVLALDASADSPLVNPAFVVENWNGAAKVTVVSKGVKSDVPVHIGYVQHLSGDTLILFLPVQSQQPTQIRIDPAAR
ncbi:MAG: LamG domain-containing protein [Terracidiphilus sp.]